jgi:hypothetical protein
MGAALVHLAGHSESQVLRDDWLATDGVRPPTSGSVQPRRWRPRSAGQQSRGLTAAFRSAARNDPLSFLLRNVGRGRSQFARPGGLVLQSSPNGDRVASMDPVPRWGPPRCHRHAARSSGRWTHHHRHPQPSPSQSDRQSDPAAALAAGWFHGLRLTKRQKLRQQRSGSTVGQQGTNLRDDPLVFGRASVGHDLSDRVERPTTGHCAPTRSKSRRADLHRIKQRHQPPGALNFEGPLRTAALAASPAAAMTLRPPANKMALHGRKHPLSFRQRQPGPPWGVFATAASPLTS